MRTYKDIDVKFYDTKGSVHVRCNVPVTEDALVHFELMQSHYCKLSFKLGKAVYFKMGDFIETDFGRFELTDNVKPKDDGSLGYSYELQFDAYYRKWKNKRLKYMPNSGSPEGTFSLTSNILTHANVIKDNLDFLAKVSKSYLYDPNYTGSGTDYTFVVDASVDKTKSKAITYSNSSILDAIANIAQTFDCEWWVEGNIVHFGTCENTNEVVDFKDGENIVSMSSSQSQSSYANRVYAFGAARNLPSGYKQNSSADVTKNGVVEKRLMLPTLEECSDENKKLMVENGFELKDGCLQVNGLTEDEYVEGVTTNDDIYPRNLIKTSNVTYYEKEVEDESTPEEGDYIKRTYYKVNGLAIVDKDGNKTGDMAFRSSYILSGKTLHIIFQSGSLSGMDFECQFNPDGKSEILRDANGSPILKDGKEQVNPEAQVFEVVANEDYGRFLPDTVLHPKDGDTFVLYNWDSTKLGDTLVNSSANELLTDTIKNLKKSMIDPTTYTCTAASGYSYNNGEGTFHFEGDRVNLYNKGYDEAFRASRIIGYELHLDIPFDSVKYTVGEKPAYSRLNAMSSQIEELIFNGQSYLNQGGTGGNSIYIIKSYDTIVQPTDFNVFSAKRVEKSYLHKDKDDTAQGTLTFEKIQKFLTGLQLGTFSNMSGGDWSMDEEGRSHLITDYLEVRMKAFFEELVIKKTSTIGGKELISPAGSNVISDVEEVTVTYDGVSQVAYRCYFLAEQDGEKVDNDWAVGDQARSESFNVKAGTYHKAGNHFFWRLVIGCNDTDKPVEREGKNYHYIDISSLDYATASDVPMKGDVVNQCGNRNDITRQNCLVLSAVDTYSPSITLYHGINSYSFENHEYVEYGVVKSTGKAFFNVYGDAYIGDRPTKDNSYEGDSYIKYDSGKKKLVIKAEIEAKSTFDGKSLEQYISEKSLDEEAITNIVNNSQVISDLQNQIDGAIETWFYDGVPTLTNAPASDWKTDADKNIHLGDLYYDNLTGKAYRFALDGSVYKWTVITDTDVVKALADAAKAQETADGKMTVFNTQPTPPYQTGDIWVNATYPASTGTTYKNDLLRCKTAKGEGKTFSIDDWVLASRYTDDTVANEAKKAAENAQGAAKKAQEAVTTLDKTVGNNRKDFDKFTEDGYLDSSEIAAMAQDSKRLEDDFAAAEKSYDDVVSAEVLKNTKQLTDLQSAFATMKTAKEDLVSYLSDIVTRYNESDSDGKTAINAAVARKYTLFSESYDAFYNKLGLANAYITSTIYGKLMENITDTTGLNYLKTALAQKSDIKGGLFLTSMIALRDGDNNIQSGINGVPDSTAKGNGIATWWGGEAVDKDYNDGSVAPAVSIIRFDGSGYFANGAISWDTEGNLTANPMSFIINKQNLGAYLAFFKPTWKGTDTSSADQVSYLKPCAPFSELTVLGDTTIEGGVLKIGGAYLVYKNGSLMMSADAKGEKALNVFATGGISAYGSSSASGAGGGLNGSIIPYATAINKTTSDESTEVASAWSIKRLSDRIKEVSSAIPSISVDVPTSGNAITGASYDEATGKLSFTKGTFLTSHQSLSDYLKSADAAKTYAPISHTHAWADITDHPTKVSQFTNDSGYTTNKGTVTSVKLTAPTGFTVTNGTVTTSGTIALGFATGYSLPSDATQKNWTSAYDWYKLMTTDEETADGIINKWNEVVSFLAGIKQTDTLDAIVDGINTSISTNANNITTLQGYFKDGVANNADKLDGIHASGLLTELSNTNNNIHIVIGGTAKSLTVGYAAKASQLYTARKLWGNSFDGSADVSGDMTGIGGTGNARFNIKGVATTVDYIHLYVDGGGNNSRYLVLQNGYGNVGIGTASPSEKLHVAGKININGIVLEYDSTNKALKVNGSLYATGGITAYGEGSATGSGGLNGSVLSYTDAIKQTAEDTSKLASAYSIAKLKSLIDDVSSSALTEVDWSSITNKPSTFTPSSHTHTFASLTSKPTSLSGFGITDGVNSVSVSGSGNAVTSASVSGHTLTLTKGSTFLTSHQSLAGYATQSWVQNTATAHNADMVDGVHNGSLTAKYFAQVIESGDCLKYTPGIRDIDGNISNAPNGETSNANYGIITFGIDSRRKWLAMEYTSGRLYTNTKYTFNSGATWISPGWRSIAFLADIPKKLSSFTNDSGYITSSGSCNYASSAGSVAWGNVTNKPFNWSGQGGQPSWLWGSNNGSNYYVWNPSNFNVNSAKKLSTARTLWGQSFDGTSNIAGEFTYNTGDNVLKIWDSGNGNDEKVYIQSQIDGRTDNYDINSYGGYGRHRIIFQPRGGRVGIVETSPSYTLSVGGEGTCKIASKLMVGTAYNNTSLNVLGGISLISSKGSVLRIEENTKDDNFWIQAYGNGKTIHFSKVSGMISPFQQTLCLDGAKGTSDIDKSPGIGFHIQNINWASLKYCNDYFAFFNSACNGYKDVRVASLLASGGITAYSSSDLRLKSNLHKADSLKLIKSLGTVYEFDYTRTHEHSYGLIAQNVQKSRLCDLVGKDDEGYLKLNYWSPKLISLALGGIVQVDDKVSRLKRKVRALEKRIKELESKNNVEQK